MGAGSSELIWLTVSEAGALAAASLLEEKFAIAAHMPIEPAG